MTVAHTQHDGKAWNLVIPHHITSQWVEALQTGLESATHLPIGQVKNALPADAVVALLDRLEAVLKVEPTLVEVRGPASRSL
jgi:hypothetical protein